ncbi:MAG: hypothetical protein ABR608_08835, partial [Pseudonocardiaceae bacterium]
TLVRQAVLVHASWPVQVARGAGRQWRSDPQWAAGWIGDRGALTNPRSSRVSCSARRCWDPVSGCGSGGWTGNRPRGPVR